MKQGVGGTAAIVTMVSLGTPIIGTAVEAALAWHFGTSKITDEYRTAALLPLWASQIFLAQVCPWLIVPLMSERRAKDAGRESWNAICWLTALAAIVGGLGVVATFCWPRAVAGSLAPGLVFSPGFKVLVRCAALAAAMVMCAAVLNGLLHHYKLMVTAQLAQILPNLTLLALICTASAVRETALAWGLIAGSLMMLVAQITVVGWLIRTHHVVLAQCFVPPTPAEIADLLRRAAPVVMLAATTPVSALVINRTLSGMPSGSIAAFGFAWKPLLIASIAPASLATVLLPYLSEAHLSGNTIRSRVLIGRSLRLTAIIAGPASVFLFVMRESVVRILLFRGALDSHAAGEVSRYFGLALLQAPAGCLITVLQRIFIGSNRLRIAIHGAAIASLLPAPFLGALAARAGTPGIICALDAGIWCGTAYLLLALARRSEPEDWRKGGEATFATIAAACVCGLCAFGSRLLLHLSMNAPLQFHILALVVTGVLCSIATYSIAGSMGITELRDAVRRTAGWLRGRPSEIWSDTAA